MAGVALFLIGFVVSYLRNDSLTWASIVATAALCITVGAGLLLTSFIRLQPVPVALPAHEAAAQPTTVSRKGNRFDVSLDDEDTPSEAAA